ncbi:hypothetical protein llap_9775 [Limosa lapponica baueri]|uniref:Uncharacterized protein n=1 Tax=Limosa lapponica baueri TaxID=1758121 RepID=A0A2I0U1M3_LIMLA|nr:hypothetical protein llap_9775 [Limosa lapponica baueri]
MPAGSKMDPSLDKAEPISVSGGFALCEYVIVLRLLADDGPFLQIPLGSLSGSRSYQTPDLKMPKTEYNPTNDSRRWLFSLASSHFQVLDPTCPASLQGSLQHGHVRIQMSRFNLCLLTCIE